MDASEAALVKATLTHLDSLETITVLWNPTAYSLSKRSRLATAAGFGAGTSSLQAAVGGEERFSTRLLLDSTREPPGRRDLRPLAGKLESWMEPHADGVLPPRLLFAWGSFRFRGVLAALDQHWVLFDKDGAATRGWLDLTLRR